ncbi:MAG: hypothetical protein HZA20_00515 [Nitrospirae bacterium]|nr:hypothetical protein [Nitrospirota bacterium]
MSPQAISRRLAQAGALRKLCLSLARSSAGREIAVKHPDNKTVKRTSKALGL